MSRFKIGQTVVCVDDRETEHILKQGEPYVVDGFNCCNRCGLDTIFIKGLVEHIRSVCPCSHKQEERENYRTSRFAPLEEIESAIENLMEQSNIITKK